MYSYMELHLQPWLALSSTIIKHKCRGGSYLQLWLAWLPLPCFDVRKLSNIDFPDWFTPRDLAIGLVLKGELFAYIPIWSTPKWRGVASIEKGLFKHSLYFTAEYLMSRKACSRHKLTFQLILVISLKSHLPFTQELQQLPSLNPPPRVVSADGTGLL